MNLRRAKNIPEAMEILVNDEGYELLGWDQHAGVARLYHVGHKIFPKFWHHIAHWIAAACTFGLWGIVYGALLILDTLSIYCKAHTVIVSERGNRRVRVKFKRGRKVVA